jgi:predicted RNA-binding protein with PUA-like domain
VVGLGEVASEAYPDPTPFDPASAYFDAASKREQPRWMLVDVRFTRKLTRIIALGELRQQAALDDFALLRRGNRLSILPVTKAQWNYILSLE